VSDDGSSPLRPINPPSHVSLPLIGRHSGPAPSCLLYSGEERDSCKGKSVLQLTVLCSSSVRLRNRLHTTILRFSVFQHPHGLHVSGSTSHLQALIFFFVFLATIIFSMSLTYVCCSLSTPWFRYSSISEYYYRTYLPLHIVKILAITNYSKYMLTL
jgi:hypothetical protein